MLRSALLSFNFFVIPVVGTFIGSSDWRDPDVIDFYVDENFPVWSGGSETVMSSSSFAFDSIEFYHKISASLDLVAK